MTGNPTTVVKTRKQVLIPPGKPVPKDEDSFVTPKGGDLKVDYHGQYGLFVITQPSGGPLPAELAGRYTHKSLAVKAIESYLNKYWKNRS